MSKDLKIKIFEVNPLGVNCYVVSDDTKEAVIIDCGCFHIDEWNEIKSFIDNEGLDVKHLLNTHLHFDHIMGVPMAFNDLGLCPEANKNDSYIYNKVEEQVRQVVGANIPHIEMPPLGRELRDGDEVEFGSHKFVVIQTPGHTPGGICFYCKEENVIFTGDTLFRMSVGRTDLQGGSYKDLQQSIIERLATLPSNTIVYPGHGPSTTIEEEAKYNPYFN